MGVKLGSAVVLGVLLTGSGLFAQVPKASSGEQNHALDKVTQAEGTPDQMFLKTAIEGNNGEIAAAKMALKKSKNDQVKQFAQKMVDDHTKMLGDLHQVEQGQKLRYEDKPSPMAVQMSMKLKGLSGAAFDKAFVDGMVKDHEDDVRDFTKESETGTNASVKEAATKSLPTIKEHLEMVQGLQRSIG